MQKTLKLGPEADHSFLINEMGNRGYRMFSAYAYELRLFARLRNAIIHNPYKKTAHPIATPHKDIVEKYEYIKNSAINPPKALSVAVPGANISTATLKTNVQELMKNMIKMSYTHIPIIDKNEMIGVFSENTLFCYVVETKDCIITSDATIELLKEFIAPEKHMNEFFVFVDRNTLLHEVEEIFDQGLKDKKRIAVVYVTEHGKSGEKLLGMITAWDLAGNQKKVL